MLMSTRNVRDRVSNGAGALVHTAKIQGRRMKDYAVAHKAITIAGIVAIGALGFGLYALMRLRNR
jgi:hypothetical protein